MYVKLINNLHPHSFFSESCLKFQLDVQVITTKHALHFFDPSLLSVKCHVDEEEWVRASPHDHGFGWCALITKNSLISTILTLLLQEWKQKGDPVLHIEVHHTAHCMLSTDV